MIQQRIIRKVTVLLTTEWFAESSCKEDVWFGSTFLKTQEDGAPDLSTIDINTDAGIAMLYATGGVTNEVSGEARLQASIYKSTDTNLNLPYEMDPMELGITLTNEPTNVEVHLIIRDHGKLVEDDNIIQTLADSDVYCNDPPFLWEGFKQNVTGNICSDYQMVAFGPNEEGVKNLMFVNTGKEATQAKAHIFRRGDSLQTVVFTNVYEEEE